MLSDARIEKIGWVKNMWQIWIKSKAETNDTILQYDIVSLFRNFRGAASDYLCDFFEEIRKEDGNPYPPRKLSHIMTVMCMLLKDEGINVFSSPFRHAIRCKCAGIAREQIFPFTS